MELDQVVPVGIGLKLLNAAIEGTLPRLVRRENAHQPLGQVAGHLSQIHPAPGPGGAFYLVAVAQVVVELLQRFDN